MTSLLDYAYPMSTHNYKHLYVLFRADVYWLMEVFCFVFVFFVSAQVLFCLRKPWRLVTSLNFIIVHYFSQDKCKNFINEYRGSCPELIKYERTFQTVNIPVLLVAPNCFYGTVNLIFLSHYLITVTLISSLWNTHYCI